MMCLCIHYTHVHTIIIITYKLISPSNEIDWGCLSRVWASDTGSRFTVKMMTFDQYSQCSLYIDFLFIMYHTE